MTTPACNSPDKQITTNILPDGPTLLFRRKLLGTSSIAYPPPPPTIKSGHGGRIVQPNPNDVLCGRGGRINAHEGNMYFRKVVAQWKPHYMDKSHKSIVKAHIAAHIVNLIRGLKPEGRFLKKEGDGGMWVDIGDACARTKTSQALRDNVSVGVKLSARKGNKTNTKSRLGVEGLQENTICKPSYEVKLKDFSHRHVHCHATHQVSTITDRIDPTTDNYDQTFSVSPSEIGELLSFDACNSNVTTASISLFFHRKEAHLYSPNEPIDHQSDKRATWQKGSSVLRKLRNDGDDGFETSSRISTNSRQRTTDLIPSESSPKNNWASPFMELDESVSSVSLLTFQDHASHNDGMPRSIAECALKACETFRDDADWMYDAYVGIDFPIIDEDLVPLGHVSVSVLLSSGEGFDMGSKVDGSLQGQGYEMVPQASKQENDEPKIQWEDILSPPLFSSITSLLPASDCSVHEPFMSLSSCC